MLIYIIIVLCAWILALSPKYKESRKVQVVFAIFLILILCFGYMTGSDWRSYEKWYLWQNIGQINLFETFKEPGYYVYTSVFKFIGVKFWTFFIFTKVILFIVLFRFVKKLYPENIFLFWMLFLPMSGYFMFVDNPMRNVIAVVISLLAFKYLVNRSFLKFSIYTLIAMSFHTSAIIMFFIYFLSGLKMKNSTLIIGFLIVNIFFSSQAFLINFIELVFSHIPYKYISAMISRFFFEKDTPLRGSVISFGLILNTIWFFVILSNRQAIEKRLKYGKDIFKMAIIYPYMFRLGLTLQLLVRFQLFFVVFFVIAIVSILRFLKPQLRAGYITFVFLVSLILCKSLMSYKYVPYTNYLTYAISGNFPSYEYRSTYNLIHSPYK